MPRTPTAAFQLLVFPDRLSPAHLTITTTANSDSRDSVLSLREAIRLHLGTLAVADLTPAEQAQVDSSVQPLGPSDTIRFALGIAPATIALTTPLEPIGGTLTLVGPTAPLTLSASQANRVFDVVPGVELT